jgi:hypothetical protein
MFLYHQANPEVCCHCHVFMWTKATPFRIYLNRGELGSSFMYVVTQYVGCWTGHFKSEKKLNELHIVAVSRILEASPTSDICLP